MPPSNNNNSSRNGSLDFWLSSQNVHFFSNLKQNFVSGSTDARPFLKTDVLSQHPCTEGEGAGLFVKFSS